MLAAPRVDARTRHANRLSLSLCRSVCVYLEPFSGHDRLCLSRVVYVYRSVTNPRISISMVLLFFIFRLSFYISLSQLWMLRHVFVNASFKDDGVASPTVRRATNRSRCCSSLFLSVLVL